MLDWGWIEGDQGRSSRYVGDGITLKLYKLRGRRGGARVIGGHGSERPGIASRSRRPQSSGTNLRYTTGGGGGRAG